MRKLALGVVLVVVAVFTSGCCAVPQKLVKDIEDTNAKILPKYLKYVEADANLDAGKKDDEKKLVESLQRVVEALKKQVE
jgi:hypothetical protein